MKALPRLVALISDLRLAIVLLLVIAIASGVGTAIPQRETAEFYHRLYDPQPWLGLLPGEGVLALQLDHIYSSGWFLGLLAWLALALLLCSWRRQWPALRASLRWIDYRKPRQLSKLSLAESLATDQPAASLEKLGQLLEGKGWQIRRQGDRLAARKGLLGKVGPLLVHAGMVVLMLGAAWGAVAGQRAEQYLAPGRSLELMDSRGSSKLTLALDNFSIQRDPAGRPEQFTSQLRILEGDGSDGSLLKQAEISPGGEALEVKGLPIRVASVLPASGILLKRDPGVPLVYAGFAIALTGGGLSLVATRQLWAIAEEGPGPGQLHVAGLCNRNLTGFAAELPQLLSQL